MIQVLIKKSTDPDFVDRTDQLRDIAITQGATKEASVGRLSVDWYAGKYQPSGEDEVKVYDGDDLIFGGFIVRVSQTVEQGPVVKYECDLKNKVYRLDYKLANTTYEGENAHDIIVDLVSHFSGPGITTDNVEDDEDAVIEYIAFNNIPVSEAIQQVADIFNKDWYVDPDGDIHFFSKFSESAPFNLNDTGGKYIFDSLEVIEDYTQIKNSILIQGGKELSTLDETEKFIADGEQFTFVLSREYSDITITDNGTPLSVGIANIDDFTSDDVLYNFNTRSIQFDPTSPPADTHEIVVSGKYYFPIAVRFREAGSISKYGERQFLIQDTGISSRTDAVARALAEIEAYAEKVSEGSFTTNESGLMAGQKINIQSDIRGFNKDFIIQRLSGKLISPEIFEWKADIVSVKTFEIIDLLAQIIKGRRVEVQRDAVIQNAERVNKRVAVSRTILVREPVSVDRTVAVARDYRVYYNDPPIWVAGPYSPTSLDDRHRVAFADRGCEAS